MKNKLIFTFNKIIIFLLLLNLLNLINCNKKYLNNNIQIINKYNLSELFNDVKNIQIEFISGFFKDNKYSINNPIIINKLLNILNKNKILQKKENLSNLFNIVKITMNEKDFYFNYDSFNEKGYYVINNQYYLIDWAFFRYIEEFLEYRNYDFNIEEQYIKLFNKYKWSIDYRINKFILKLPDTLIHKANEFPIKLYWAYNLELSKDCEEESFIEEITKTKKKKIKIINKPLDFTEYLGKNVTIDIFKLNEELPDFLKPKKNSRGITLTYDNKIIGAFIDAGRPNSLACSLKRRSFEEITNLEFDDWITKFIDINDENEKKIATLSCEQIITDFINKIQNKNNNILYYLTRSHQILYLFLNMDNNKLYNEYFINDIEYDKKIKIDNIELIDDRIQDYRVYKVNFSKTFFDKFLSKEIDYPNFFIMKKEHNLLNWKIDSIQTKEQFIF